MHLAIKMISQPPVVVESRQVRAADVADLQLLVARGTRRFRQFLQFLLEGGLFLELELDAVELVAG